MMARSPSRQATSDKIGRVRAARASRARKLKARAESDVAASAIATIDLTTDAAKKDLKLVLDVKGTIAGIVVDETGQPVAEVQVNAFPDILGGESPDAILLAGMSSATTDGAGQFTIRGLPDGAYRVRAARSSGARRYDWGQHGVAAKTGDKNVKITLAAPGIDQRQDRASRAAPRRRSRRSSSARRHRPPRTQDGTFKLRSVDARQATTSRARRRVRRSSRSRTSTVAAGQDRPMSAR